MAHIVGGIVGHHITRQLAYNAGKLAAPYAIKYVRKHLSSHRNVEIANNLKRKAESFVPIDTVPLKRHQVPCPTEEECARDGYFDFYITPNTASRNWAGAGTTPFTPVQGDDISNRRGRSVMIKRILMRFDFRVQNQQWFTGVSYGTDPVVRYVVYIDKCNNGAVSTPDLLMSSAGDAVENFRNLLYNDRFDVLVDKTFVLSPKLYFDSVAGVSMSGNATTHKEIDIYEDIPIRYNAGNSGTNTDALENALYVAVISGTDTAGRVCYDVRYSYHCRVTFESLSKF